MCQKPKPRKQMNGVDRLEKEPHSEKKYGKLFEKNLLEAIIGDPAILVGLKKVKLQP